MFRWLLIILLFSPVTVKATGENTLPQFFNFINQLQFRKAEQLAQSEKNNVLKGEMIQLSQILYYAGQIDKAAFILSTNSSATDKSVSILQQLNKGYFNLFYSPTKGEAYKHFYSAYQLSKETKTPYLIKACLFAILRYHNFEIAQNSEAYLPYLEHYESLQSDSTDHTWLVLYKMIFYSKSLSKVDKEYFPLSNELDQYEINHPHSLLLTAIYYEKALKLDIEKNKVQANQYFQKTIAQAADYPFLRYHRFFASLKLMMNETTAQNFSAAHRYMEQAKKEVNQADSLRSMYYLNLYSAFLLHEQKKDSLAFNTLWKAYRQEYQLDHRRNTLEINRLNVELETQEKEYANLKLREGRIWLIAGIIGFALLSVITYFAFANQRREKQVQSMKAEKMLKDQEVLAIDSMIQGQERERQKIADDLHDNLGGLLATVRYHFQSLRKKKNTLTEAETNFLLEKTDGLIDEAYHKVRSIAHAGNVGVNAKEGLLPAVRRFASKVSVLNQLTIEVEDNGMNERIDNSLEITIFRVIQELITNIIKHAQATTVTIHLTKYDESINLMVEDNGIGFEISKIKPEETMGLYSIQKKMENIGGRVTIDSIVKKGTSIIIDIPLT